MSDPKESEYQQWEKIRQQTYEEGIARDEAFDVWRKTNKEAVELAFEIVAAFVKNGPGKIEVIARKIAQLVEENKRLRDELPPDCTVGEMAERLRKAEDGKVHAEDQRMDAHILLEKIELFLFPHRKSGETCMPYDDLPWEVERRLREAPAKKEESAG